MNQKRLIWEWTTLKRDVLYETLCAGDAEEVPEWEEVKGGVHWALSITAEEAAEEEPS